MLECGLPHSLLMRLPNSERTIYFVAVPLMVTVSAALVWLVPFSTETRVTITALSLVGAAYAVLSYWLRTRRRWRGLRYTTPIVTVTLITVGVLAVGVASPLAYLLYFPAIIFSSIRAGRNIGIAAAGLAAAGYLVGVLQNSARPNSIYDVIFVTVILFIVAALSGAMADEERGLRREAQERRLREQSALRRLADGLVNAPDLNATLHTAVEMTSQILDADGVTLVMPDGAGLVVETAQGLMAANRERRIEPDSASVSARAMASGQPAAAADFAETIKTQLEPWEQDQGINSALAAPMLREGRAQGVLTVYNREPLPRTAAQVHLLTLIGNQTLVAIERKRAEDLVRHEVARSQALVRVAGRLNTERSLEAVLDAICEETARALNAPIVTISLYDGQQQALLPAHAYGLPAAFLARMQPVPRATYDEFVRAGGTTALVAEDVQALPNIPNQELYTEIGLRTTVSVSMLNEGNLIGRLNIGTVGAVRHFSPEDLALLQGVADQAALAISNARLFDTVERELVVRKRAELALLKTKDELELRVAERTNELRNANEQLRLELRQRQRSASALRESEERYRLLFDSNPHPMWVYDPETLQFVTVNEAAQQHYGYSEAEFLSMTLRDMLPPEDVPALMADLARTRPNLYRAGIWRHAKKDGTLIDVEIIVHALDLGGRLARLALVRDVTEQKRIEQRRQAQYAVTRVLAESASLDQASPQLLQAICEGMEWARGEFWTRESTTLRLQVQAAWQEAGLSQAPLEGIEREVAALLGQGQADRIWEQSQPVWVRDLGDRQNAPWAPVAGRAGLRGAFGFPVRNGQTAEGFFVFYSKSPCNPDPDLVRLALALGTQVTGYIDRIRGEEERAALLVKEQAARAEAEAAQRRLAFLAEASSLLATSLDYAETLQSVARLALPHIADWCIIALWEDGQKLRHVAVEHLDPAKVKWAKELEQRYPPDLRPTGGLGRVLHTGKAELYAEISDQALVASARDPEHLRLLRELGLASVMIVPLVTQGRVLGAITFILSGAGRRYGEADLALAQELARRAALAVDSARLYSQTREALEQVQAGKAEIERLNAELEQRVSERTAELEAANRELESFSYSASHDLQEPLRKVQAFGDRLRIKYGQALTAEGLDYLERMQSAAGRMQTLIHDLLALSRVTTMGLPFTPVDLGQIAREVVSDLELTIEQTGGQVEIGELPVIDADPIQMRQLLQNLIGNALKFHRAGAAPGVKVYEGTPVVREGSNPAEGDGRDGLMHQILVEDDGIGFDEKYLERIFMPFQRLHGRAEYDGTGIGLAICRKIVERHGGTITAHSVPGAGARFVVTFPARKTQSEEFE